MLPFLELPQQRSTGQRLMHGLGIAAQGIPDMIGQLQLQKQNKQENEAIKRITGQDLTGLSPDLRKEFVKSYTGAHAIKQQEKQKNIQTALGTIQEMRGLIASAGPSNFIQGLLPGETSRNRAQLAQYGKSLIPLVAAGVSIRNQKEFDEYKKIITDPNARQDRITGALDGLQNLLQRTLSQGSEIGPQEGQEGTSKMVRLKDPKTGKVYRVPSEKAESLMSQGAQKI